MTDAVKTPEEWSRVLGIHILDPDGWRTRTAPAWATPITEAEFRRRAAHSTVYTRDESYYKPGPTNGKDQP